MKWLLVTILSLFAAFTHSVLASTAESYRNRLPEDEIIYFLLPDRFENGDRSNDRGGLQGNRLVTGFDPTAKGFFHGGDLKGLTSRLDYIQGLGATAIWVGPIFKNKPVQGAPGDESAGYHGYWVSDFTSVDPHFGTNADFKFFVNAAHARGLKVYMDIITNHTADVIAYRECPKSDCPYRSRADYPYTREGGPNGRPINDGFAGDSIHTADNFGRLNNPNYAYHPYIPAGQADAKKPDWLNNILLYHNRGNSTYRNESSTMGDFVGLDDLMTENPRVVQGFIDIYNSWIDIYGIDGFRIDTAKHVNPEFWQAFIPAMLTRAKARGIPNFHIFGEIGGIGLEPGKLAVHTRVAGFPAVLDFAFHAAVIDTVAGESGTDHLAALFAGDPLYAGGEATARRLPTFISSHDDGRLAHFIRAANPTATDDEILHRVRLGYAMLLTLRGVPTIYAGDEQGFVGHGGDQDAREDMFASKVASYNDNKLLGTSSTTAVSHFNPAHPLYALLSTLAKLRHDSPALRRGNQIVRNYSEKPGVFAVSRIDPENGQEVLVIFNTSKTAFKGSVEINATTSKFTSLYGTCPAKPTAPASLAVSLPSLDFIMCQGSSEQ